MNWSKSMRAGFVSAAIVSDDAALSQVTRALSAARLRDVLEEMPAAAVRRATLPSLLAHFTRPPAAASAWPARARPLIAAHFARDLARVWLAGVPAARPGYRAQADFVAWLRRTVARTKPEHGEAR